MRKVYDGHIPGRENLFNLEILNSTNIFGFYAINLFFEKIFVVLADKCGSPEMGRLIQNPSFTSIHLINNNL